MYPIEGLKLCTDPKPGDILVCDYNFPSNIVHVTFANTSMVYGHWVRTLEEVPDLRQNPLHMGRSHSYYYAKRPERKLSGFAKFVRGVET